MHIAAAMTNVQSPFRPFFQIASSGTTLLDRTQPGVEICQLARLFHLLHLLHLKLLSSFLAGVKLHVVTACGQHVTTRATAAAILLCSFMFYLILFMLASHVFPWCHLTLSAKARRKAWKTVARKVSTSTRLPSAHGEGVSRCLIARFVARQLPYAAPLGNVLPRKWFSDVE